MMPRAVSVININGEELLGQNARHLPHSKLPPRPPATETEACFPRLNAEQLQRQAARRRRIDRQLGFGRSRYPSYEWAQKPQQPTSVNDFIARFRFSPALSPEERPRVEPPWWQKHSPKDRGSGGMNTVSKESPPLVGCTRAESAAPELEVAPTLGPHLKGNVREEGVVQRRRVRVLWDIESAPPALGPHGTFHTAVALERTLFELVESELGWSGNVAPTRSKTLCFCHSGALEVTQREQLGAACVTVVDVGTATARELVEGECAETSRDFEPATTVVCLVLALRDLVGIVRPLKILADLGFRVVALVPKDDCSSSAPTDGLGTLALESVCWRLLEWDDVRVRAISDTRGDGPQGSGGTTLTSCAMIDSEPQSIATMDCGTPLTLSGKERSELICAAEMVDAESQTQDFDGGAPPVISCEGASSALCTMVDATAQTIGDAECEKSACAVVDATAQTSEVRIGQCESSGVFDEIDSRNNTLEKTTFTSVSEQRASSTEGNAATTPQAGELLTTPIASALAVTEVHRVQCDLSSEKKGNTENRISVASSVDRSSTESVAQGGSVQKMEIVAESSIELRGQEDLHVDDDPRDQGVDTVDGSFVHSDSPPAVELLSTIEPRSSQVKCSREEKRGEAKEISDGSEAEQKHRSRDSGRLRRVLSSDCHSNIAHHDKVEAESGSDGCGRGDRHIDEVRGEHRIDSLISVPSDLHPDELGPGRQRRSRKEGKRCEVVETLADSETEQKHRNRDSGRLRHDRSSVGHSNIPTSVHRDRVVPEQGGGETVDGSFLRHSIVPPRPDPVPLDACPLWLPPVTMMVSERNAIDSLQCLKSRIQDELSVLRRRHGQDQSASLRLRTQGSVVAHYGIKHQCTRSDDATAPDTNPASALREEAQALLRTLREQYSHRRLTENV